MKLSDNQEDKLLAVKRAKTRYDQEIAMLELALRQKKESLKNPVRLAVDAAKDAGVPVRQIHQRGLGMNQVNSMLNFLAPSESPDERLNRILGTVDVDALTTDAVPAHGVEHMWRKGYNLYYHDDEADRDIKIPFMPLAPHIPVSKTPFDGLPDHIVDEMKARVGKGDWADLEWEDAEDD